MLHVAFVHSVNVLGGAERMSEALVAGLDKQEYQFSLISPEPGNLSSTFAGHGAALLFAEQFQPSISQPFSTWRSYRQWRTLLKSSAIDILHTGDLICTRSLIKAANSLQIPVVCHIHFPLEEPFVSWVFKKMPVPTAFVFCSEELQKSTGEILAKYCPKTPQQVIHNGVNTQYFKPLLEPQQKQDELTHIGIVANLQLRKGHDDFIDMAREVVKSHQNVHFDVIGGDILQNPREAILKKKVTDYGLSSFFTFHGQLSDVRDAINMLDIYVCASHQEAFPVSILEAMACQKPIVSTNVNGIPEALQNNKNAILIEPHNPSAMSSAIKMLLSEPSLATLMSNQARRDVEDNFSLELYCNMFAKLYYEFCT